MAKPRASVPGETAAVIEREALNLFHAKGFHATSIREIASAAGIVPATLFYHFAVKEDILLRIMHRSIDSTIERVEAARATGVDSTTRLAAVVDALVHAHTALQMQSLVNNTELRSLRPEAAREVVAKRSALARIVERIVEEGCECGVFHVERPKEAANAIVTMVTSIATWYRPQKSRRPEQISAAYVTYSLRIVGVASVA